MSTSELTALGSTLVNGNPAISTLNLPPASLFRSFWMAGFECACHINSRGQRLDMIAAVQHDLFAAQDYAMLQSAGIRSARDGIRWHLIDKGGRYDFSSFVPMLDAAVQNGIQVIWDVCHYGWPDGLDVFSAEFVDRFARFSAAVARVVADRSSDVPFYSPMNEISFLCWAACRDIIYPFAAGRDSELKLQLIRATLASCDAIRSVDPRARFVYPEPIVHVVPPRNRPELAADAARYCEAQFEAWEMMSGRLHPELGGDSKYLDIIGVNFYHANQWEHPTGRLRWEDTPRDDRWMPLHRMLAEVYERYHRPIFVAETSHFGSGRARWIREIADEVFQARMNGTPVEGICLYPILDRYDWENPNHWHNSGLWDLSLNGDGSYHRAINQEYAVEVKSAQEKLASIGCE
jgi:hypothetical protein